MEEDTPRKSLKQNKARVGNLSIWLARYRELYIQPTKNPRSNKQMWNICKGKEIIGRYHKANSCTDTAGKTKGNVKPRSLANVGS